MAALLLLLDGTDELTPDGFKIAVDYIKAIKHLYPKTRMVVTSSGDFLDGLFNFKLYSIFACCLEYNAA